jgi:hypothetical protein
MLCFIWLKTGLELTSTAQRTIRSRAFVENKPRFVIRYRSQPDSLWQLHGARTDFEEADRIAFELRTHGFEVQVLNH